MQSFLIPTQVVGGVVFWRAIGTGSLFEGRTSHLGSYCNDKEAQYLQTTALALLISSVRK